MSELQRTPLYQQSIELKGRMTAFAGWEMAVQFSGLTNEHQAVRNNAGMFDISHMGKFFSPDPNSISLLQQLVPSDLSKLQVGQAQYTVLLNEQAGVIDDIIVYLEPAGQVTLIVNAGTKDADLRWLRSYIPDIQDLSADLALIAGLCRWFNYSFTELWSLSRFNLWHRSFYCSYWLYR
jgi:aminomethyltransferase